MTNQEMLAKAYALAAQVHQRQRYGVLPYMYHVSGVAASVVKWGPRVQTIALLHDVIEDSDLTLETLEVHGFPGSVVAAVDRLTHRKSDTYADYIGAMMGPTDAQRAAMVVKIADLKFNINHPPVTDTGAQYTSWMERRDKYVFWQLRLRQWHTDRGFADPLRDIT